MIKLSIIPIVLLFLTSCVTTIPLQSNLDNQTLLLAENRNIKADYTLSSDVPNGYLTLKNTLLDGSQTERNNVYQYQSETAFNNIWKAYFDSKFNAYSDESMKITVRLKDMYVENQLATSVGMQVLTGNNKRNVSANALIAVEVDYLGENYKNEFSVTASDYNETQTGTIGSSYYSVSETNPTRQVSMLLESALNKSIVQFENFLRAITSE